MKKVALIIALVAPVVAQSISGTWSSTLSVNGVSIPFLIGPSAENTLTSR